MTAITPAQLVHALDVHTHGAARFILARGKAQLDAGPPRLVRAETALTAMDAAGLNVKLACKVADLIALDCDAGFSDLIALDDRLAAAPRVTRQNAPGRGKVIVYGPDAVELDRSGDGRRMEVKTRDALIAGMHPSGAPLRASWDGLMIPIYSAAELATLAARFIPTATETRPPLNASSGRGAPPTDRSHDGETLYRAAIRWKCAQPDFVADVETELARRPADRSRRYVALRDERTPSARIVEYDGRAMLRDYGNGTTRDYVDVWIELRGLNKRDYLARVVDEYLTAHGKPTLDQLAARRGARR